MSDQEESINEITNCDEQRLWHQNPNEDDYYTSIVDELSAGFEVPSFPLQEAINEDVVGFGQPSGIKRKGDYDPMETPCVEEDGVKEYSDRSDQSKHQKRTLAEVHNQNERLRRQRLKEKIKALQELIPNCSKRDKSSTFDDAIKYIKTLQNQVQAMSMGAGYSTLNSPLTIMPNPAPFLQTGPPSIGIKYGIGTRTGMSAMFPSLGLPNQCLLPSSAASRMPLNFTSPVVLSPTSIESHGSKSASQGATSHSSQGPIFSEQSSTRRDSTTRVLPSRVVQPHHNKEVSHSGSTEERSSSSTAKWKGPLFLTGISLLEDDDDGWP